MNSKKITALLFPLFNFRNVANSATHRDHCPRGEKCDIIKIISLLYYSEQIKILSGYDKAEAMLWPVKDIQLIWCIIAVQNKSESAFLDR